MRHTVQVLVRRGLGGWRDVVPPLPSEGAAIAHVRGLNDLWPDEYRVLAPDGSVVFQTGGSARGKRTDAELRSAPAASASHPLTGEAA